MRSRHAFYVITTLVALAITWSAASVANAACQPGDYGICGGDRDNTLYGSNFDEDFHAYAGNDTVWAFGGSDNIWAGQGNDTVRGDFCDPKIFTGSMCGSAGDPGFMDTIYGAGGNDILYGDQGRDHVYGGADNDELRGGDGNDYLDGGDGLDAIYGGAGNDTIVTGFFTATEGDPLADSYADVVDCGAGEDTVYLGPGEYRLSRDGSRVIPKALIVNCEYHEIGG